MAYLLSNTCTQNYWNRTTTVEITVGGWVVFFFELQCSCFQFPSLLFLFGSVKQIKLAIRQLLGARKYIPSYRIVSSQPGN